MHSFTLATLLASTATATTQIPFFIPGFASSPSLAITPDASIVRADPHTTVMALGCPTDTASSPSTSSIDPNEPISEDDSDDYDPNCPWGTSALTVSVIGTAQYALSVPDVGVTFDCTSKGDMTCTAGIAQEFTDAGSFFSAGTDGRATGTTVYGGGEVVFQTARVTAGEEKLGGGKTASASASDAEETGVTMKTSASTGAAPKETGAAATGKASGSVSGEASGSPSGTSSAVPGQATGKAARFGVESAAWVVLAGAAVAQVL